MDKYFVTQCDDHYAVHREVDLVRDDRFSIVCKDLELLHNIMIVDLHLLPVEELWSGFDPTIIETYIHNGIR